MSARAHDVPAEGAAEDGRAALPANHRPPHVARLLALQSAAGNGAVRALLARQPTTTVAPRAAFESRMRARYGVTTVRAGTETDQVAEMRSQTPTAEASPTSISGWQAWDPAASSDLYDPVSAGFDAVARSLGGIPDVTEIRFLDTDYVNDAGTARRETSHGAHYGAGVLTIFRRIESAGWPLPDGRSTAAARAGVISGSPAESRRRIIVHELGHGIAERFATPGLAGSEQGFFRAWSQAAGWSGGAIVQNGTTLTTANWNDPWPEQPVSRYSLANPGEDFAESIMAYVEAPDVLRARSPARFAFIDGRRAGWSGHLRAPVTSNP
jgi:hypothetical protein